MADDDKMDALLREMKDLKENFVLVASQLHRLVNLTVAIRQLLEEAAQVRRDEKAGVV